MGKDEDREQARRFREQQKRAADQRRQDALNEAARAEDETLRRYSKKVDADFDSEMRDLFGGELDEIQRHADKAPEFQVDQYMSVIRDSVNRGDYKKARKVARKNKAKIREAVKAGKKKGCGVISILIIGGLVSAFGSAGWLAIDTIGALLK